MIILSDTTSKYRLCRKFWALIRPASSILDPPGYQKLFDEKFFSRFFGKNRHFSTQIQHFRKQKMTPHSRAHSDGHLELLYDLLARFWTHLGTKNFSTQQFFSSIFWWKTTFSAQNQHFRKKKITPHSRAHSDGHLELLYDLLARF